MERVSSDTNVWIDFALINRLDLPFNLPYEYLMCEDAVEDELLSPSGLKERLLRYGLRKTEIVGEEFFLAEEFLGRYARLSTYDGIALAIAKNRGILLLSGDGPLRRAATAENVKVIGTIAILDRLLNGRLIEKDEYRLCLKGLLELNGRSIRLPEDELKKRLL